MKKLATLLLAAGLVFGAATGASAIDFKAKGQWIMSFDYGQSMVAQKRSMDNQKKKQVTGFNGQSDSFDAKQRVRLQLDAVASESLSGTVFFEIGDQAWGKASQGGALGADGTVVEVKRAYIDWIVPQTDLKLRMGLQGVKLPTFTTGDSQVFDNDVAAVVASYKFNDTVALTALWARPYNDNFTGNSTTATKSYQPGNFLDNMDMFAVLVPLTFDGVKVTPWVSYAAIGKNTFDTNRSAPGTSYINSQVIPGMTPAVYALNGDRKNRPNAYGDVFWAGLTGEITMADPFRFAWDANYGSSTNGIEAMKREGFYVSILGEYKMDWATPGLYAWYSSGDDSNIKNGSERMPSLSADGNNGFSNFAGNGAPYVHSNREGLLGANMMGTWGIGARLKDMSFLEDLKHTFRINYIGGTNSPTMAKYILGKKQLGDPYSNPPKTNLAVNDFYSYDNKINQTYLTTQDKALELGLTTTYKVYDNLTMYADIEYMALFLDQSRSVWGKSGDGKVGNVKIQDPWNVNVSFVYDF